jgi:HAD superfamily hydrolase (TIGR01509 family)
LSASTTERADLRVSTGRFALPEDPRRLPRTARSAVLFDLDGVLWNSNRVHAEAFDIVSLANDLTPVDYLELAGLPTEAAWAAIGHRNGRQWGVAEITRLSAAKRTIARSRLRTDPPLAAGLELLGALTSAGVALGLVTGSSANTVNVFLDVLAQPGRFSVVVSADDEPVGKPSPKPYLRAARALGVDPGDCWAIEDSAAGLASAISAGTKVAHLSAGDCFDQHRGAIQCCVNDIRSFIRMVIADVS